jgi:hypothetical protein
LPRETKFKLKYNMKQRGRKSAASLAILGKPHIVASNPHPEPPEPPLDLAEPEQVIWRTVTTEYRGSLTSYTVLHSALKMHERARIANKTIQDEGLVIEGDRGARAHPLIAVEREARRSFEMSFRRLGIKL